MEDFINGPIPFGPPEEVVGDSNHTLNQGLEMKIIFMSLQALSSRLPKKILRWLPKMKPSI
ncbi:elongation factor P [Sesbania bispinosa]|nr:elongation factor P [Sesbania bispinosa]